MGWWANAMGVTGSPFDAFLTVRGLRTLHARMGLHESNAEAVVAALGSHPAVTRIYHPSLEDHPGHTVALSQQSGFGGMVSFEVAGGEEAVRAFLNGLRMFTLAESLGGVESLVCHPATMTHASMDEAARAAAGIGDSLLRLSVGIETADDLVADLRVGLDRVQVSLRSEVDPQSATDPHPGARQPYASIPADAIFRAPQPSILRRRNTCP